MNEPTALDVLRRLVDKLDHCSINYMLVGSFASSLHGEPRSTQDIDIVVDTDEDGLSRLLEDLPAGAWYVDHTTARRALRSRSQFNVIDMATVWKVDIIFRKADSHAQSAFSRRVRGRVGDVAVTAESAEDTVISKLRWAALAGGSERQIRDVAGVLKVREGELDFDYVEVWVDRLGLRDMLDAAIAAAVVPTGEE